MDDNTFDDSMSGEKRHVSLARRLLSAGFRGIPSTSSCESQAGMIPADVLGKVSLLFCLQHNCISELLHGCLQDAARHCAVPAVPQMHLPAACQHDDGVKLVRGFGRCIMHIITTHTPHPQVKEITQGTNSTPAR